MNKTNETIIGNINAYEVSENSFDLTKTKKNSSNKHKQTGERFCRRPSTPCWKVTPLLLEETEFSIKNNENSPLLEGSSQKDIVNINLSDNELSCSMDEENSGNLQIDHNTFAEATNSDKIKDLIESPILNKGLSPRLNRMMMKSKFSTSLQVDSENIEDVDNEENVLLLDNNEEISNKKSVISSNMIKSVNISPSCGPGSFRAMNILKAASQSLETQKFKSLIDSKSNGTCVTKSISSINESNSVGSQINSKTKINQYFKPTIKPSLQSSSPSIISSISPAAYSRGTVLLQAIKNYLTPPKIINSSPFKEEVSLDEKTSSMNNENLTPVGSIVPILKSPLSSANKKKKVLFTDPVVSAKLYFDSCYSTLNNSKFEQPINDLQESDVENAEKITNKARIENALDDSLGDHKSFQLRSRKITRKWKNVLENDVVSRNENTDPPINSEEFNQTIENNSFSSFDQTDNQSENQASLEMVNENIGDPKDNNESTETLNADQSIRNNLEKSEIVEIIDGQEEEIHQTSTTDTSVPHDSETIQPENEQNEMQSSTEKTSDVEQDGSIQNPDVDGMTESDPDKIIEDDNSQSPENSVLDAATSNQQPDQTPKEFDCSFMPRSVAILNAANKENNSDQSSRIDYKKLFSISNRNDSKSASQSSSFSSPSHRALILLQAASKNPRDDNPSKSIDNLSTKSILKMTCEGSTNSVKKKRVNFSEPVVSCELVFDQSTSTLNDNKRKRSSSFDESQLSDFKERFSEQFFENESTNGSLSTKKEPEKNMESSTGSEWVSLLSKRRKLCHQKATLEDCDDYNKNEDTDQPKISGNDLQSDLKSFIDSYEEEDNECVYFSMSEYDDGSLEDTESKSDKNIQATKVDSMDVSRTEAEDNAASCENSKDPIELNSYVIKSIESSSSDSFEVLTQKEYNNDKTSSDEKESQIFTQILEENACENTEIPVEQSINLVPEENDTLNTQPADQDELITIQMPLKLAKEFYNFLGKYIAKYEKEK
ncbi:hypothetical protein SSS_02705 [Sarcoptes scabiei]|uniref:Uncharacterized protein n=1 Tax=Sarcoptes scabiei TaxID=52283 RepID=A0A834RBW6_SARSC|nr:hypothetical protein SSS_02705 [Sarcoptes scabiei]